MDGGGQKKPKPVPPQVKVAIASDKAGMPAPPKLKSKSTKEPSRLGVPYTRRQMARIAEAKAKAKSGKGDWVTPRVLSRQQQLDINDAMNDVKMAGRADQFGRVYGSPQRRESVRQGRLDKWLDDIQQGKKK